ncbi:MAG TPA: hypothetical protein VFM77_17455 [Terriglobales bacterium]|nr:hypothetical protein [Terriglobales bacterium]
MKSTAAQEAVFMMMTSWKMIWAVSSGMQYTLILSVKRLPNYHDPANHKWVVRRIANSQDYRNANNVL